VEVLDEAAAVRVTTELPRTAGRYSFSHALIRETLYGELTTTRRVRLHRQIGEALEGLYGAHPEPHLAELAYHFFEAAPGGDVERAIAYAVRAGDRARALMAHEQAAHHYEMGLHALELHERRDPGRCRMLLMLSDTLWCAGEYERAKAVAREAAELARTLGAGEELARAALAYGGRLLAFAAVQPDDALIGLCEEALARLGGESDALRAGLLGRLAEEITFSASLERRDALCRDALATARRVGDAAVIAHALRSTHWALWGPDTLAERLSQAEEIIQLAERIGDRALMLEGHAFRLFDLCERGDVAAAQHELEHCARLADELRQPYYRWGVIIGRVLLAFAGGRLADVEPLAQQMLEIGQRTENPNAPLVFGIQLAQLRREQGNYQELEAFLMGLDQYPWILPNLRCARALLYFEQGHEAKARAECAEIVANIGALPRNLGWLFTLSYLAETCARLADVEHAPALYELLRPFAQHHVTIGPVVALGSAAHPLGLLAVALGRQAEASDHFEVALAMNARTGTLQALARTQLDYADLLLARNRGEDRLKALELINRGLDTAQALGMRRVVERALALKLRAQGVTAAGNVQTSIDAVAAIVRREPAALRRHAAPDGTVTILFTDIEGSTAMTERLGDRRWVELLRAHNAIVREHVAAHGGFEVKSQGDGFMLAFQSARRALQCAVALQRAFATYNGAHADEPLRVRIGLHAGEVIKEADDFIGKNVILAARIAAQAHGGEILVSGLFRELMESANEFSFSVPREIELKGLSGMWRVHTVAWEP
jgi:class 3 adenylate cyclase